MTGAEFLFYCEAITFTLLTAAFVLSIWRITVGPSIPDRILALDMLVAVAVGFILTFGIHSEFYLYLDIAIALGLVGFLSTVALARFVLARGSTEDLIPAEQKYAEEAAQRAKVGND